jgi:L,D-transpeptidase ErfK/SrfK
MASASNIRDNDHQAITEHFHMDNQYPRKAESRVTRPQRAGILIALALASLIPTHSGDTFAAQFDLPNDDSTVVGKVRIVRPGKENTLLDIARRFDIGYHEITAANPTQDIWLPNPSIPLIIPSQFVLPPKPWKGIVINIPQRRLFYFPPPAKNKPEQVWTFPVSIAREGWSTPLGDTQITGKHKDPGWFVPKSIQQEKLLEGEVNFPTYFPPGPENPMGMLAMQTGFEGIFIHGTNKPWGVGMRTSHGCFHLYPEDAATLFQDIRQGTPVRIMDQPFAVGVYQGQLAMASYPPVGEYNARQNPFTRAILAITPWLYEKDETGQAKYLVDWRQVQELTLKSQVLPTPINPDAMPIEEALSKMPVEDYIWPPYGDDANTARPPRESTSPATPP